MAGSYQRLDKDLKQNGPTTASRSLYSPAEISLLRCIGKVPANEKMLIELITARSGATPISLKVLSLVLYVLAKTDQLSLCNAILDSIEFEKQHVIRISEFMKLAVDADCAELIGLYIKKIRKDDILKLAIMLNLYQSTSEMMLKEIHPFTYAVKSDKAKAAKAFLDEGIFLKEAIPYVGKLPKDSLTRQAIEGYIKENDIRISSTKCIIA